MFGSRRLKRFAVVTAIFGLLLNAAAPMLANAAAAMRGVSTGQICEVYGFRIPSSPGDAHAMAPGDDADDDAGMAMDDGATIHDATAHGAMVHEATAHAADGATADPHHHDGPGGLQHGGHCALTALAAFAPAVDALAPLPAPSEVAGRPLPVASPGAIFDAAARWTMRLKHGPPEPA